ncbi:MAG: TonB-dependent receptor plug domain-containing protein, partial [Chitinophagaceae bacterium]
MRKIASLLTILMFMTTLVFAQDRTITGTVIDETGASVPGASIRIKGTRTGVAADNNGQFSIQAKTGDILLVSGAGIEAAEAKVGTGNTIAILAKTNFVTGSEVIVTGVAGATTREKLTVSVTKISAERINAVPPTSLASALTGKVAGVKTSSFGGLPGQALDIQLRADNNLNNVGSGPLIIVDGAILSGSLADINADDVESMEVVKGAAASALYGSRAGNGVISVTTKRGKGFGIGSTITVRNEIGFQNLAKELETAKHHYYTLAPDWESQRGNFTKYAGIVYPTGY